MNIHDATERAYRNGYAKGREDALAADVVEVRHGEWIIKINYKTPVSHAHIRKENKRR